MSEMLLLDKRTQGLIEDYVPQGDILEGVVCVCREAAFRTYVFPPICFVGNMITYATVVCLSLFVAEKFILSYSRASVELCHLIARFFDGVRQFGVRYLAVQSDDSCFFLQIHYRLFDARQAFQSLCHVHDAVIAHHAFDR